MELDLTPAERACLQHAANGRTVPETAVLLTKGDATVKAQLLRARLKLGARNTTHAVAIALRRGLIE